MPSTVHVGTIPMKEWPGMPPLAGFETEPGWGEWSMDAFTLDRKIHAAGWSFFFTAAEVKVMFFGSLRAREVTERVEANSGQREASTSMALRLPRSLGGTSSAYPM